MKIPLLKFIPDFSIQSGIFDSAVIISQLMRYKSNWSVEPCQEA